MLCVRTDPPVDLLTLRVLEAVATVAAELGHSWFVTGAMARDILLKNVYGLSTGEGTKDVDLAVAMASWQQFAEMKRRLLKSGKFVEAEGTAHRLYYRDQPGNSGYPLDVIPFGDIDEGKQLIAWPPDMAEIMNVIGYDEALATAVEVQVSAGLVVRVASLPGLAVLKIFAWMDRGNADPKDAMDLLTLLRKYADAGNAERLHGSELPMLELVDYNMDLAGARLLGRDARGIVSAATAEKLLSILNDRNERLAIDMSRALSGVEDRITEAERFLSQFRAGLAG